MPPLQFNQSTRCHKLLWPTPSTCLPGTMKWPMPGWSHCHKFHPQQKSRNKQIFNTTIKPNWLVSGYEMRRSLFVCVPKNETLGTRPTHVTAWYKDNCMIKYLSHITNLICDLIIWTLMPTLFSSQPISDRFLTLHGSRSKNVVEEDEARERGPIGPRSLFTGRSPLWRRFLSTMFLWSHTDEWASFN